MPFTIPIWILFIAIAINKNDNKRILIPFWKIGAEDWCTFKDPDVHYRNNVLKYEIFIRLF